MRALARHGQAYITVKPCLHAASTGGRVLRRQQTPLLKELDPVTETVIRAPCCSAQQYEYDHPQSLLRIDVKKLGRTPMLGSWWPHGRSKQVRGRGISYDYVHAAIDDHSRVAYSEIHADERTDTRLRSVVWLLSMPSHRNSSIHIASVGAVRIEQLNRTLACQ